MSLLHIDGMDLYTSYSDPSFPYFNMSNMNFSTSAGRFGGGCVEFTSAYGRFTYGLPSSQSEIWVGFAFGPTDTNSSNRSVIGFASGSGLEAMVTYNPSSGNWTGWRGSESTNLGSNSKSIGSSGAYHWIEVHYKMSSSSGIIEVWVDGNQVLDITSANTTQYSNSSFVNVTFGDVTGAETGMGGYLDDIYILNLSGSYNNARIGDSRIETLKPSSDAGPNDGTLTSGSNHNAMVDENQNDGNTSTITLANTSGQEELFGSASLSGSPAVIHAVKISVIAEKTDAGVCALETVISSSGAGATGPSTGLTTNYTVVGGIFETDPNTSSPFLYTAVNALEFGFEMP
jgi:hypothetical protein